MPGRRIEMRKVKEVLRLRLTAGLSNRKIALCTGVGKSVVSKHVARADELGLDWASVEAMDEEALEARLYPDTKQASPRAGAARLGRGGARAAAEGVTKRLLWEDTRSGTVGWRLQQVPGCAPVEGCIEPVMARAPGRRAMLRGLRGPDPGSRRPLDGEVRQAQSSWPCWGRATTPSSTSPGNSRRGLPGVPPANRGGLRAASANLRPG
jgi:hypothetical protein